MKLIIIRHALPNRQENADHEGPADPGLSQLGLAQAEAVAEFLVGEHVDHVVASSMRRARETALPLAAMIERDVELRDDLREVDQHRNRYVPAEEMTLEDPFVQQVIKDPMAIFDGEYDSFRDRVVSAFDDIVASNPDRTVAVFCHGMVTAVYLQALWELRTPFNLAPDYTGITRVQASADGLRTIQSINETGHVRHLLTVHRGFGPLAQGRGA